MNPKIKEKKLDTFSRNLSRTLHQVEKLQLRKDLNSDDKYVLEKLNQNLNCALGMISCWRLGD